MTDRDRPVPGQGPEAWRASNAGAPDLLELQATDALLDRLALRLPTSQDLGDPLSAALVALTAEVDAGLPAERSNGRNSGGLKGSTNGRRANGQANGHVNGHVNGNSNGHLNGNSNGHTFGYADLRPGVNGHRPEVLGGDRNDGPGRHRDDDFGLQGYEIIGDGGELRPQPQRPASLADWKDRLVDLATRKPLSVLGAAAATVGIIFGAVAVGQNLTPLPASPLSPGDPSVSQTQLNGINSALSRADLAARQGQVGSARQALKDAEQAVERLPASAAKDTYRKKIEKLRLKVDKTVLPSVDPSGIAGLSGVVTTPAGVTTSPGVSVTSSPSGSVTGSPTLSPTPTESPTTVTTSPTSSPSGTILPGGEMTEDPTSTSTDGGVLIGVDDPTETTTTTAP